MEPWLSGEYICVEAAGKFSLDLGENWKKGWLPWACLCSSSFFCSILVNMPVRCTGREKSAD
jgi:hypothetical protein